MTQFRNINILASENKEGVVGQLFFWNIVLQLVLNCQRCQPRFNSPLPCRQIQEKFGKKAVQLSLVGLADISFDFRTYCRFFDSANKSPGNGCQELGPDGENASDRRRVASCCRARGGGASPPSQVAHSQAWQGFRGGKPEPSAAAVPQLDVLLHVDNSLGRLCKLR